MRQLSELKANDRFVTSLTKRAGHVVIPFSAKHKKDEDGVLVLFDDDIVSKWCHKNVIVREEN